MDRTTALERLRATVTAGRPVIGGGAGTGISAKSSEAGGIDLIIIYNSGRYRMAGRGSLAGLMAYGDANAIVMEMANEVLPVVKDTPVLAGVNGTDPFRVMGTFLDDVKRAGFAGVQNFPTVGLIDGTFRANLEETGMGFEHEIEMIRAAHERDLLTAPYVFDPEQARAMAYQHRIAPATLAEAEVVLVDQHAHTSGEFTVAIGDHGDVLGLLIFRPFVHDESVVDRH